MIKRFCFFLFVFAIILPNVIEGQTIHVRYKKFIVPGQKEYERWMSSPEMKRRMREREEMMANGVSEYYELVSDGKKSFFSYDTTIQTIEIKEESPWWSRSNEVKESYSKDMIRGEVTVRSSILPDSIAKGWNYKEKYSWVPDKGMKVFADLRCEKMINLDQESGDSIIIWYTPSVPIADGPEDFAGVPGLVLAVEAPSYNFIAESLKVGSYAMEKGPLPKEKFLKEKEFKELVRTEVIKKYINRKD